MKRNFDIVRLFERLQNGEKITCLECGKGVYMPVGKNIKACHCFICSNCTSMVEELPADIIVE